VNHTLAKIDLQCDVIGYLLLMSHFHVHTLHELRVKVDREKESWFGFVNSKLIP